MRDSIGSDIVSARKEVSFVDREKMRRLRYEKVNTGKGRKVGFFETIGLKVTGFFDGRRGFPRQTDDKGWYSPFMNRDVNSYEEFCSHTWGSLQIENEGEYARMEELMDGILRKQSLLMAAREDLAVASRGGSVQEPLRKKGEDKLTDTQVLARRKAEKDKRLAPLKSKVSGLEQELKEAEAALSDLHSKLAEDDNTTRLICHRVREHILMRMDVYWNSALRYHPDSTAMPVVPVVELKEEAEEVYLRPHKELMQRAKKLHEMFQDETVGEVA